MIGWRNTRDALEKLEELLTCKVCASVVSDPCSLEACDHIFCRACIEKLVGTDSKCPECGAFAWVKDMKTNRQLANTVSMCAKIRFLVGSDDGDDDKVENSNIPTNTINNNVVWEETQAGFDQGTDSYHFSSPDVITAKSSSNKCGIAIQEIARSNKRTNKGPGSSTCGKASIRTSTKDQQTHKNKGDDGVVSCQKDKQGVENAPKEDGGKLILACQNGKLLSREESILEKDDVGSKHPKVFKRVQAKEKCYGKQFIKTRSITKKKTFSCTIPVSPCNDQDIESTEQAGQLRLPENDDNLQFRAEQEDSCILESENENEDGERFTRIKSRAEFSTGPLGDGKGENNIPKTRAQKRKQSEKQTNASPQQKLNNLSDSSQRVTSDKKRKINKNNMDTAVKQGDNNRKILAQNFCSPQNPTSGSPGVKRNKRGETSLHVAAIKGCVETVRKLLREGADPNTKDHAGWTPLHEACNHGYLSIVELLLDHGAMIDIPGGFDHDTPLHDAVTNGRLEVARVLVSRGAPLDIRNKQGLVPVDYAATKEMQTVLSTSTPSKGSGSATRITAPPLRGKCSHDSPKVLLATGLSSEQKANLQTCALILNAEIVKEFSLSVTHIVTAANSKGVCPRTIKYLNGVLTGKWIVKYEWIEKTLRRKSWLDEAPFEVKGTHATTVDAPKRARMNALKQLPGLFDGCQFYFYGGFRPPHPPKEDLIQMVKYGGGRILSREPKASLDETLCLPTSHKGNRASSQPFSLAPVAYHANPESKQYRCTQYIIYDSLAEKKPHIWDTDSLCTMPLTWLMDCASNFAILHSVGLPLPQTQLKEAAQRSLFWTQRITGSVLRCFADGTNQSLVSSARRLPGWGLLKWQMTRKNSYKSNTYQVPLRVLA